MGDTLVAADPPDTLVAADPPDTLVAADPQGTGAAGGASSGSSSSSSGSAKPIALKAAPKVKDVTPCVDPDQAPTCVKACEPIPAIICGPGRPAPDTVDGSPATCYILPTGPEACNYCPASFSRFCP